MGQLGPIEGLKGMGSPEELGEESFPCQGVTLIRLKMLLGILCPKQLSCVRYGYTYSCF